MVAAIKPRHGTKPFLGEDETMKQPSGNCHIYLASPFCEILCVVLKSLSIPALSIDPESKHILIAESRYLLRIHYGRRGRINELLHVRMPASDAIWFIHHVDGDGGQVIKLAISIIVDAAIKRDYTSPVVYGTS